MSTSAKKQKTEDDASGSGPRSTPSGSISKSGTGAPAVIGLRIHKTPEKDTKWLYEGDAVIIGRTLTGLVLPDGLESLDPELFVNGDPAMHEIHAILWVSGGRVSVSLLRQGDGPAPGDENYFKLSAQRKDEKIWFELGKAPGDEHELHRDVKYICASKDKSYIIKVDWNTNTRMHSSRLEATKRATVRIGVYSKTKRKFLGVGSGVVIAGPGDLAFAQVLTAAHVLMDMTQKFSNGTLNHNFKKLHSSLDDVVITVAEYVSDEECHWKYRAKVVTPESLLKKEVTPGATGMGSTWLNDQAVLRVVAPLEITPMPYQSPLASHTLGAMQPEYTTAAPCTLRDAGLKLAEVHTDLVGSSASSFGWYAEYGGLTLGLQKSVTLVPEYKIMSNNSGWLEYNGPLDSGGSGGPVVGADGRVLATNSISVKQPGNNNTNIDRSYSRSVSMLTDAHGLLRK